MAVVPLLDYFYAEKISKRQWALLLLFLLELSFSLLELSFFQLLFFLFFKTGFFLSSCFRSIYPNSNWFPFLFSNFFFFKLNTFILFRPLLFFIETMWSNPRGHRFCMLILPLKYSILFLSFQFICFIICQLLFIFPLFLFPLLSIYFRYELALSFFKELEKVVYGKDNSNEKTEDAASSTNLGLEVSDPRLEHDKCPRKDKRYH